MRGMSTTAAFLLAAISSSASAAVVVPGTANPFLAGQTVGTNCCGGDSVPAQSPTLALSGALGGQTFMFTTSGGTNFAGGTPSPTADGEDPSFLFNMTADYGTGVSGPLGVYVDGLVGVFVSGVPAGAAPGQLNSGTTFTVLTPGLNQIFWIGDGLTGTGSGTLQQFTAPAGATALYLGTVDGSGWANNSGTITVGIATAGAAPEASTWAMMLIGFAGVGFVGYRARKNAAQAA